MPRPITGAQPCPQCRQPTHHGPDAPNLGIPTRTDTTPLTRAGELAALLDGRKTYEISRTPRGRTEISYRDHWRINRSQHPTVVATHICGHPTPREWAAPQPPTPSRHDTPPY